MKIFSSTIFFIFFLKISLFGQSLVLQNDPIEGEILIQLTEKTSPESILKNWQEMLPQLQNWPEKVHFSQISAPFRIFKVEFSENFISKNELLAAALHTEGVEIAQFVFPVEERKKVPDDPQYFKQIDFDLIRAAEAWEGSTGGISPQGDTIVVAVLEKGCFRDHPDLRENMWKNSGEIPKNGIDDDQNGFKDDFLGWDFKNNNDGPGVVGPHGVAVTGILGARGDNSEGVSGINWNVKIMSLTNIQTTAEIVAAYSYAFEMRKKYNQTNGQKGAFVVATNASFGISGKWPADQPLWCRMYDSLGVAGIVSVGATDNANINVDIAGDLPSTCPSEYLIIVTNIGDNDVKINGAAYGQTHVDIGAPGEGCHTTDFRVNGSDTLFYGPFSGTSAATPHVTGTVAWMYSLPCETLMSDAKTDPESCARRMRKLILESAEANSSVKDIVSTGGRLDMLNILNKARELCGGTIGELEILDISPSISSGENLLVSYQTPDFIPYTVFVVDVFGRVMEELRIKPDQFSQKVFSVETEHLSSGTYRIVLFNRSGVTSKSFVKVRN